MASSNGPVGAGPELLLRLDRDDPVALHEQIERSIRDDIRSGRLAAGSRLPSSRTLAGELGVSRGVVTEAYGQLAAEGYLHTRQGAPVRVASAVRASAPRAPARSLLPSFAYHFHPGLPDLAGFPRDRWLRSLRAAWRQAPIGAIGYADPRGVPELREALAEYLGRVRGAATDPEHTLICTGFTQGLSLLCRWLAAQEVERVALEDPGWHPHRLIVEQAGLEVVPVPVDAEGLRVDLLRASGATAVIVTPAHQFPTGCVMSSERRAALIEWAETGDGLIVEDDFDAEFRYDRGGVGALQGLAPERVVLIGSASKRLAPAMRLGWMLSPSWLAWTLISAKTVEDSGSEAVGQLALQDFVVRGELDRHLRRMRLRYEEPARRAARVAGAVGAGLRPRRRRRRPLRAGRASRGVDEASLIAAAAERGVGVEGVSLHRFIGDGPPALVLGFGNLPEPAIEHGVRLLGEAIEAESG